MASIMGVRQAAQLDMAAERAGATAADMDKLSQGDTLAHILPFIRGMAIIQIVKHVIDLAKAPFCPDGWKVEEHQKGDPNFEWNPTKVEFYLDENQKTGVIKGTELRRKLKGQPVLNANLLYYLLAHPELIPDEWKGKCIYFWGTIYRASDGDLSVRYLYWSGRRWKSHYLWLDYGFGDDGPALVSASG